MQSSAFTKSCFSLQTDVSDLFPNSTNTLPLRFYLCRNLDHPLEKYQKKGHAPLNPLFWWLLRRRVPPGWAPSTHGHPLPHHHPTSSVCEFIEENQSHEKGWWKIQYWTLSKTTLSQKSNYHGFNSHMEESQTGKRADLSGRDDICYSKNNISISIRQWLQHLVECLPWWQWNLREPRLCSQRMITVCQIMVQSRKQKLARQIITVDDNFT